MSAASQNAWSLVLKGTTRELTPPSCLFTPGDLRKLYRLLETKAIEAADRQIAFLQRQPDQTEDQFTEMKRTLSSALSLIVRIFTARGDWVGGTVIDPLEDEQLPDGITKIEFESAAIYKRNTNQNPNNSFLVRIDFTRSSIMDMGSEPASNVSAITISAIDPTWASAIYDELQTFFRQRSTKRGWLHSRQSYNAVLLLLGFPLSFDAVYHLDHRFNRPASLAEPLSVAMYVYVVLIVLFFFRILFNYGRWVFPKMEIDAPRQHSGAGHRVVISTLALMVISVLVKAVLRILGIS